MNDGRLVLALYVGRELLLLLLLLYHATRAVEHFRTRTSCSSYSIAAAGPLARTLILLLLSLLRALPFPPSLRQ